MFKKVCVILTSLCLLTACSVNEDLVKDKEAKTKDEKTSEYYVWTSPPNTVK